jgi:hypothetical protein
MRRRRGVLLTAAAGLAASVALSGCVNLPTSGVLPQVNELPSSTGGSQSGVVVTPIPPAAQWQPKQIVSGFLAASGAEAANPSRLNVAREYLTSAYAHAWNPSPAATVVDDTPKLTSIQISSHVTGGQVSDQVTLTSEHLESMVSANANEAGSILASSQPRPYYFDFSLVQQDGRWRIAGITGPGVFANSVLLLTNSDFQRDYEPRNLYFPAVSAPHTLVPFPVYVPDQGGSLGVEQLVDGLTSLPPPSSNWLYRSVTTAFPSGTRLTSSIARSHKGKDWSAISVQVPPHTNQAVISLSGAAANVRPAVLEEMKAQLVWTLTYSPYSAGSGIGSVAIQIGGKSTQLYPSSFDSWVPAPASGPVYFQTLTAANQPEIDSVGAHLTPKPHRKSVPYTTVVLPNGLGRGPLAAVAVSPPSPDRPGGAPTFAGCRQKTVYVEPLYLQGDLTTQTLPSYCTSLSWDDSGNLWVAAGSNVFRINETSRGLAVVLVTIPASQLAQDTFTSLRVAADGVRVAMIAHDRSSASVIVTSISQQRGSSLVYLARTQQVVTVGSNLAQPVALSWWDSDHLLVLNRVGTRSQLYDVPLNGGTPTRIPTPRGTISVSANGSSLAVGATGSQGLNEPAVRVSRDLGAVWHVLRGASTPSYSG